MMSEQILFVLLRTSLAVALTSVLVVVVLKYCRCRSSRIHRIAWAFVLLQGVLWMRIPLELPVLTPPAMESSLPEFEFETEFYPEEPAIMTEHQVIDHQNTTRRQVQKSELHTQSELRSWVMKKVADVTLGIWLAGLLATLSLRCFGLYRLARQMKSAKPATDELLHDKKFRILLTDHFGPAIFRHTIFVPETLWEESSESVRRGILKHELSHARHRDGLKSLLLSLVVMVHWFNPLAWLALKKFNEAAEWRCDSEAFGSEKNGLATFAESMLALNRCEPKYLAWVQAYKNQDIKERVRRLQEQHLTAKESTMKKLGILCLVVVLFGFGLVKVQLVAQNEQPQNEPGTVSPNPETQSPARDVREAVRDSQLSLAVARAELTTLEEANRMHPGSISVLEIEKAKRKVAEAELAHKQTKEKPATTDGGFATPGGPGISGFTHIVTWGPKGDFNPRTPREYLRISHAHPDSKSVYRGYFRTKNVDGKLIASNLTDTPEKLRKMIESTPEFEYVKTERLTKESFEAYEKTKQETLPPTPPADGGFATPGQYGVSGFTHLITYGPKGDFSPRTPMDYLSIANPILWKSKVYMGYFRTKIVDGKLIAMNLTDDPEAYRKVVESIPQFEYLGTERLTKESFEAYEKMQQLSLPPTDGGYAADGGHTHIVVFRPQGDFAPKTVKQLLDAVSFQKMHEYAVQLGYFRTKPVGGKLVGSFLTPDPEKFEKMLESIPSLEFVSSERLTKEKFEEYEKRPQLSLPDPELDKRIDDIKSTEWFKKLNEKQQYRYLSAERGFAFAFDPKNFEVGDARDEFEKKWINRLEGPEPGFPGRSQLSVYDEAILGLATIKSDKAAPLLVRIACERVVKDNAHRFFATRALGMLGDPSVVPDLIPLLYHYNVDCRWESQVALVRLTGQNFGGDEHDWAKWYNENRNKLGKNLPEFDFTPVDWTCGSDDPELKKWADREEQKKMDAR